MVCCEKFNKSDHKKVTCNYCNYDCCVSCMKKYILGMQEHARCMNNSCKKVWNRESLLSKFTKTFVNQEYKKHRENLLFEQQKALMPATQEYAEQLSKSFKLKSQCSDEKVIIDEEIRELIKKQRQLLLVKENENRNEMIERFIKLSKIRSDIKVLQFKIKTINTHYLDAVSIVFRRWNIIEGGHVNKDIIVTTPKYIKNCPTSDCKGFIDSKWKCGLCEITICNSCHEIKKEDDDHECNPDDIATATMLMQDTKACPNCAVRIHKISGCDQMYCTSCHTAFSWRTGNVETGVVHNPHYYEYINRNGAPARFRNIGDEICGGIINYHSLNTKVIELLPDYNDQMYVAAEDKKYPLEIMRISAIHRLYTHIQGVVMRNYVVNQINDMREDRAKYMINEISEQAFKNKLQKYEKEIDKKNDIRMLLEMFQNTTVDIFRKIYSSTTKEELLANAKELKELRKYFNDQSENIRKKYNSLSLMIDKMWVTVANY